MFAFGFSLGFAVLIVFELYMCSFEVDNKN